MRRTLTVRIDPALSKALERRARARGTTVSEVVREILRNALQERPLALKTGHLRGRLRLGAAGTDGWRTALRERSWRS